MLSDLPSTHQTPTKTTGPNRRPALIVHLLQFVCLLTALLSFPALAQPHQTSLRLATFEGLSPLSLNVIVFAGNYPPFNIQREGFIGGLGPSLCNEVFKRMGQPFTFRALPWNRAMETLRDGKADAVLALFKTKEREDFLAYPEEHLFRESNCFFKLKKNNLRYDGNINSLQDLPISVVEGYSYGPEIDNADFLNLRPSVGDEKMIRMVLMGRYPLGIGNCHVVSYYAHKENMESEVEFLKPQVTNSLAYIAFSKQLKHEGLAKAFSKELVLFKATKDYKELLRSFGMD